MARGGVGAEPGAARPVHVHSYRRSQPELRETGDTPETGRGGREPETEARREWAAGTTRDRAPARARCPSGLCDVVRGKAGNPTTHETGSANKVSGAGEWAAGACLLSSLSVRVEVPGLAHATHAQARGGGKAGRGCRDAVSQARACGDGVRLLSQRSLRIASERLKTASERLGIGSERLKTASERLRTP